MLYYLRNHRYEKAQRDKIISLRARYQPLNRQMRDAEHYGGESPQAFGQKKISGILPNPPEIPSIRPVVS